MVRTGDETMKRLLLISILIILPLLGCADPEREAADRLEEAKACHKKALNTAGKQREALLQDVANLLQEAVKSAPDFLEAREALVRFTWDSGQQVQAVRSAETLVRDFPSRPEAWSLKGDLLYHLAQWALARDAYQQALERGGDARELWLKLGSVSGKMEDYEAAFDAFDRASEAGADRIRVLYNLGLCYEGTGCGELALEHYLKVLEKEPAYQPVLSRLAAFYQREAMEGTPDMDKALAYAEKAYAAAPENIQVLADLADLLLARKEYDSILPLLRKALANDPEHPQLLKYKTYVERLIRDREGKG